MKLSISDQYSNWPYLAPFLRYGDLLVKNRNFPHPLAHLAPAIGVTPVKFREKLYGS